MDGDRVGLTKSLCEAFGQDSDQICFSDDGRNRKPVRHSNFYAAIASCMAQLAISKAIVNWALSDANVIGGQKSFEGFEFCTKRMPCARDHDDLIPE